MRTCVRLYLLLLVTIPLGSAQAYTLEGEVLGGDGFTLRWVYAIPSTLDTFFVTLAPNPFSPVYSFSGLAEGGYLLMAYQDLNTNLIPDLDEPRGFYGDTGLPEILQVSSDTSGIDITLSPPNTGGFTGTVSYAGAETGATYVQAYRTPLFDQLPAGMGFLLDNSGNGAYTAFVDSFGIYYARAFMDLNTNFAADPDEPQAIYGGATPAPIEVEQTNFPDNIDFTLEVHDAADPERPVLPIRVQVGDVYPNPFNHTAAIPLNLIAPEHLTIKLFDLLGRELAVLADRDFAAGSHSLAVNGRDWPTGIYWVEVQSQRTVVSKRMMLLK